MFIFVYGWQRFSKWVFKNDVIPRIEFLLSVLSADEPPPIQKPLWHVKHLHKSILPGIKHVLTRRKSNFEHVAPNRVRMCLVRISPGWKCHKIIEVFTGYGCVNPSWKTRRSGTMSNFDSSVIVLSCLMADDGNCEVENRIAREHFQLFVLFHQ